MLYMDNNNKIILRLDLYSAKIVNYSKACCHGHLSHVTDLHPIALFCFIIISI